MGVAAGGPTGDQPSSLAPEGAVAGDHQTLVVRHCHHAPGRHGMAIRLLDRPPHTMWQACDWIARYLEGGAKVFVFHTVFLSFIGLGG